MGGFINAKNEQKDLNIHYLLIVAEGTMAIPAQKYTRETFNMDTFTAHAYAFLQGERRRPWCQAASVEATDGVARDVLFTFTGSILQDMIKRPLDYKRDFTAAFAYGYIGSSNGGRNGIVRLRKEDAKMRKRIERIIASATLDDRLFFDEFEIGENREGVKIVTHRPSGWRIIGVRDTTNNHVLFADKMQY